MFLYFVCVCSYAFPLSMQILGWFRPKLSLLWDIILLSNNCRYLLPFLWHFWHFVIIFIYEPINDTGWSIKGDRLLEYIQGYIIKPFHIKIISVLPIMQYFKYSGYDVFALLFYFKGPKHQNYARDPMLKSLLWVGKWSKESSGEVSEKRNLFYY